MLPPLRSDCGARGLVVDAFSARVVLRFCVSVCLMAQRWRLRACLMLCVVCCVAFSRRTPRSAGRGVWSKNSQAKKVAASGMHRSQYNDVSPMPLFEWVAQQVGSVAGVPLAEGCVLYACVCVCACVSLWGLLVARTGDVASSRGPAAGRARGADELCSSPDTQLGIHTSARHTHLLVAGTKGGSNDVKSQS